LGTMKRNEKGRNRRIAKKASCGDRKANIPMAESKIRTETEDSEVKARAIPTTPDTTTLHPIPAKYFQ